MLPPFSLSGDSQRTQNRLLPHLFIRLSRILLCLSSRNTVSDAPDRLDLSLRELSISLITVFMVCFIGLGINRQAYDLHLLQDC